MLLKKLYEMRNKKGFTLVEIIVVLVILAVIAAIAIPSMIGFIRDARNQSLITEARAAMQAVQLLAVELAGANKALSARAAGTAATAHDNETVGANHPLRGARLDAMLAPDGILGAWITHVSYNEHGAITGIIYNAPNTRGGAAGTGGAGPTGIVQIMMGGSAEIIAAAAIPAGNARPAGTPAGGP
jgi:type IV pilus assembly protein PilA